jgi:hypothetical protein
MKLIKNIKSRKDLSVKFTLLILFVLFSANSYSQNKKTLPPAGQNAIIKNNTSGLSKTVKTELTHEALEINKQIDLIVRSDDINSANRLSDLRMKSNKHIKNTVTVDSDFNSLKAKFKKVNNRNTDNITKANIFNGNYLVASATQVEQLGPFAGRIWLIIGVGQADTGIGSSGDSLLLYNSIDNGETFSLITSIEANTGIKVNRDELDMELIESAAGAEYLHVTLGYTTDGYSGDKLITLLTFDDSGNFNENILSIPGYSSSSEYYKPRITSDNSTYLSQAYVYITFMQDSIEGITHNILSKTLKLYDPYTLAPAVTYFPQSIYSPAPSLSNDFKTQTDIAYFNNSGDSLIYVLSAYPGLEDIVYIYKSKADIDVYPNYDKILGSVFAGDQIENARVASNGGLSDRNVMITFSDNYFNIGDWDQWIFSTSDAANWTTTNIDYSGNFNSLNGDIYGKRRASGSFNIAFNNSNSCIATVASAELRNNSLYNYVFNMNDNYAYSFLYPKPAFRNVSNDSALTIWGSYYSLYATGGSNAIRINVTTAIEGIFDPGIANHVIDDKISFYLHSNIPPFNIVDSTNVYSYSCTLNNAVVFNNAPDGDYYLSAKHRNSLETWSAGPLSLINGSSWVSYSFTSSSANSFADNVVLKDGVWCFYSGDVNQDGYIDLADVLQIYNDAGVFLTGAYVLTDLNGDFSTDLSDLLIAYNNSVEFVSVIKP